MNQGILGWHIAPSGALATASVSLGADVAMNVVNTFFDGPSVSLTAGTWLIVARLGVSIATQSAITGKLWDGTTVYASGQTIPRTGGDQVDMPLSSIQTLGSTTTVKISAASSADTGAAIKAATINNASGNNATQIHAVRIG